MNLVDWKSRDFSDGGKRDIFFFIHCTTTYFLTGRSTSISPEASVDYRHHRQNPVTTEPAKVQRFKSPTEHFAI